MKDFTTKTAAIMLAAALIIGMIPSGMAWADDVEGQTPNVTSGSDVTSPSTATDDPAGEEDQNTDSADGSDGTDGSDTGSNEDSKDTSPDDSKNNSGSDSKKNDSSTSNKKKTVVVKMPKLKKAKYKSKTSLILTWKKVSKVTGYRIYIIQSNGKLKRVKTIKGASKKKATIKNLTYNKKYRFTITAYKKKGSKTYSSAYDSKGLTTKIKVSGKYKNGYKYFYAMDGTSIKDITPFIGKNPSYKIRVNTQACVTTVYIKDGRKGYTIPYKAWLCSPGLGVNATPLGTWKLGQKYRFKALNGAYGQWSVRIHDGYLFHTELYRTYGSNNTLNVREYNKLGNRASHGCIRMQCQATKWIYDNIPSGTPVEIYTSSDPGGLGKPALQQLPSWHTWDPTDPTAKSLCKKHGCHQ